MTVKVKGSVLRSRKEFVDGHFGPEAWGRVMASLPEADRREFEGMIVHVGWYPFELGARLDKAIVETLGEGNPKVFEDIGRQSARVNLSGAHQSFLRPGDPQAFLSQSKSIYGFYYNTGSREYKATGPASGEMVTHDAETFSSADCLTVIGWHKEALEMCGARDVRIMETQCRAKGDDACRYEIEWGV